MAEAARTEFSVHDYLAALRRRKWVIVAAVVLVPVAAWGFASRQPAVYQATATVATREGDLAAVVSGVQDDSYLEDPDRFATTQVALTERPSVASTVLARAGVTSESPDELLGDTNIVADQNADIFYFTVNDQNAGFAARLADAWAEEYVVLRQQFDTQPYLQAEAEVTRRAAILSARHEKSYASSLVAEAQHLGTDAELETNNAQLAELAQGSAQIAPRVTRDVAIGLALGVLLGLGLALAIEVLDTRIREPEDIASRLGSHLLARLPAPPRELRSRDELVMFAAPASLEAEAFRMLRTNLEFANIDHSVKSLLVTSAVEQEGKSTTIANLAVVEARAGKRVVLVDLDLRRPKLESLFKLGDRPGLTNVILGYATLAEATAHISIIDHESNGGFAFRDRVEDGFSSMEGLLDVIPSGPVPPDPGQFVATAALGRLLESLAARYDLVLVDSPPILRVGDALTLASKVSALLVVVRHPGMNRPTLVELRRVLDSCPTRAVGHVVTGLKPGAGYARSYYVNAPKQPDDAFLTGELV